MGHAATPTGHRAIFSLKMKRPLQRRPKFEPLITTWLPIIPVVADTLVIIGPGALAEFTDTLSNVAVAKPVVVPLVTPNPTYTLCPMVIVWLAPTCTQFA